MNTNEPVTGHRTQIYLPESLYRQIIEKANKEDISMAKMIRRIIEKSIGKEEKNAKMDKDKAWKEFFKLAGIAKTNIKDISINHDKYLGDALYEDMMEKREKYMKNRRKRKA